MNKIQPFPDFNARFKSFPWETTFGTRATIMKKQKAASTKPDG